MSELPYLFWPTQKKIKFTLQFRLLQHTIIYYTHITYTRYKDSVALSYLEGKLKHIAYKARQW